MVLGYRLSLNILLHFPPVISALLMALLRLAGLRDPGNVPWRLMEGFVLIESK